MFFLLQENAGYVLNKAKNLSKENKPHEYFDMTFQTEEKKVCAVCFSRDKYPRLKKMCSDGSSCKVIRLSMSKNGLCCRTTFSSVRLDSHSKMGALPYMEHVVNDTPIGRGLKKMCSKDMTSLRTKFNTAYYLAKAEKPYSDYPGILELQ